MSKLPSDKFILEHLRNSDAKIFNLLFDIYYVELVRYALRLTNKPEIAEEIVQEIFEKLWLRREALEINQSLSSYLFTSVRYRSINFFKNKLRNFVFEDDIINIDQPVTLTPYDELVFNDLKDALQVSIENLPEQCRIIFNLSRNSGLSNPEIAEQLGLSQKTVENQITIALKKIREFLQKNWYTIFLFFFWG